MTTSPAEVDPRLKPDLHQAVATPEERRRLLQYSMKIFEQTRTYEMAVAYYGQFFDRHVEPFFRRLNDLVLDGRGKITRKFDWRYTKKQFVFAPYGSIALRWNTPQSTAIIEVVIQNDHIRVLATNFKTLSISMNDPLRRHKIEQYVEQYSVSSDFPEPFPGAQSTYKKRKAALP